MAMVMTNMMVMLLHCCDDKHDGDVLTYVVVMPSMMMMFLHCCDDEHDSDVLSLL